jgi:hypothetical protein
MLHNVTDFDFFNVQHAFLGCYRIGFSSFGFRFFKLISNTAGDVIAVGHLSTRAEHTNQ